MIEKLVLSIVAFSLISTIIANLTTGNVYRKYISGFSGILFVIMIIKPVISLLGDGSMEKMFDKWEFTFLQDEYKVDSLVWEEEYIKATQKEYEEMIEEKLVELTCDLCHVKECSITFEESREGSDYGKILKVEMIVGVKGEIQEDTKKVSDVTKVTIGGEGENDKKEKGKAEEKGYKEMVSEIKERIGDYFELKEKMIIIELQ